MAENLTIEAPDFDRIRKQAGRATEDAVRLLWQVANNEDRQRRMGVREAIERLEVKSLNASPTATQNNYDTANSTILRFDGGTAFDLTGLKARVENAIVFVVVLGSGTVTIKNDSGSSEARNRILTFSAGDLAVATNQAVMLAYLNTRWREMKWA